MKRSLVAVWMLLILAVSVWAHGDEQHVIGTVSKVNGMNITVKTQDGSLTTVMVTTETKYLKSVKASAIIAGPSDLKAWADQRPDMINGDDTYDGFAKVWPDYAHNSTELYRARSAVCWADQINVPVLILHSRTDSFVPVSQALRMAEALKEKGKVYALHIYDHDGHSLPLNREERNHRIVDWFNKFGAKGQLQ